MRFGMREMLFLLVLLALPAASYFFVFEPRNKQINEARREVKQKQAKLEQLEAATRNIADLGVEIDKLSEAIQVFEQKLPAEREVEVILKQVWELAARHNLTPKSIRTDKPVPAAGYSELPIRLTILGDFDGFYSFLLDLEKLKRITRMPQMTVKKIPPQEGQMQADFVLSIFFEAQNRGDDPGKGRL
ncbi:MAG: type 4a pilus biogenesis protein PilO [Phycisphaeraceae bacterium]|nr:type 4a pilus biogenesis protein PilO [Phycisphaeraceae bacterium]